MHSKNGNKNVSKKKKYIKILEINKGSSNFNTNIEVLKILVKEENPTICYFTESNSNVTDDLAKSFPEYHIHHKPEPNHPLDRIVALVKRDSVSYEVQPNISDKNIASIWFKVKMSTNKFLMV